jgi:hypothetical protein
VWVGNRSKGIRVRHERKLRERARSGKEIVRRNETADS